MFTLDNETRAFIKVPVTEFSIHPDLDGYLVTTAQRDALILSEDHSAIVYDIETGILTKCRPDDLAGKAIPRSRAAFNTLRSDETVLTEIALKDFFCWPRQEYSKRQGATD